MITAGIVFQAGVTSPLGLQSAMHGFLFLVYYPALALLAVVFTSPWFGLAWTTMTAVAYILICLTVGPGLNLVDDHEKLLVLCVSLIARFERTRRQAAVEREWQLQRERIDLSQEIHDTTAQTAYMIGMGIHRVRELAGESNEELTAALDATSAMSRSAMWDLRRPIDRRPHLRGQGAGKGPAVALCDV